MEPSSDERGPVVPPPAPGEGTTGPSDGQPGGPGDGPDSPPPGRVRPLWHRVGDRWEREPPHDLLYGAIVAGFVMAVSSVHAPSGDRVVIATSLVAVGYWLAHCYVDAVSGRFHDSGHSLWDRTLTALRLNVGVLLGAVPGIAVYLIAYAFGRDAEAAALVAVWFTVVLLGVVGFLAAFRAGARGARLVGETALAAAFGGIVIAVKYLLH
ncbi:hypothetical protein CBR64_02260 [Cellulosimicrobium cellulans]|uniref:Uncharacterized protein n=1 Tax=Cellulosimicrobium cellulans TaxID=1710 RepID=A0A1Y0HQS3_CELCE|nr:MULTISPECIES: hypothetical protein [Cellulosimicrobium]ARU50492.1 hypothetical protein CBR64_02260 [Cellulosimicrobium cellulans]